MKPAFLSLSTKELLVGWCKTIGISVDLQGSDVPMVSRDGQLVEMDDTLLEEERRKDLEESQMTVSLVVDSFLKKALKDLKDMRLLMILLMIIVVVCSSCF